MKRTLIFFLIGLAISQVAQDEDAEEDTIPDGDNATEIEEEEELEYTIVMDYSDEILNITLSQKDAMNSIGNYILAKSEENSLLFTTNQLLKSDISELEDQLSDAVAKTLDFRVVEEQKLQELAQEMIILSDFNELIIEDPEVAGEILLESEGNDEETEGNSETDEDLETNHGFLFVLGLGFLFILLFTLKSSSESLVYKPFQSAIHNLLVNLCILAGMIAIVTLIYYFEYLDEDDIYVETIYTGATLFAIIWLFTGLWLIFVSQGMAITWEIYEEQLTKEEPEENNMEYAVMRKLFVINPYLPVASEYALRPDFNFAEYLKRCTSHVLKGVFSLNWLSFLLVVFTIIIWRAILYHSNFIQTIFLWGFPGVLLLLCVISLLKCRKIVKLLVSSSGSHLKIEYDYNDKVEIPVPDYLKGQIPPPKGDLDYASIYLLKCTCSYIFLGNYPNRHQLLFWFDSYGVKFMVSLIQATCVSLCLWLTVISLYYLPILHEEADDLGIAILVTGGLLFLLMAGFLIPLWIKYITIASNVEMMRNYEVIREVIENTQGDRDLRNSRLYVQFRSLWRDMIRGENIEKLEKLTGNIQRIAGEAFGIESENGFLHYSKMGAALRRIGIVMDNEQFRVFLKDCEMEYNNSVSLENFLQGIQRLTQDQNTKPKKIVCDVLKHHLKSIKITLKDLGDFLEKHRWFMRDEDIKEFLIDLHFHLDENERIDLSEIVFSY